jgi:hypothetical protein
MAKDGKPKEEKERNDNKFTVNMQQVSGTHQTTAQSQQSTSDKITIFLIIIFLLILFWFLLFMTGILSTLTHWITNK